MARWMEVLPAVTCAGCFYVGKIVEETGTGDLVDCDGTVVLQGVELRRNVEDACAYEAQLTEYTVGTSEILTAYSSEVPVSAPFLVQIDDLGVCLSPGGGTTTWEGRGAATSYLEAFITSDGACSDTCAELTADVESMSMLVELCDESGDHASNADAAPQPPYTPVEGPFDHLRTQGPMPGRYVFAIMSRSGSRVCAVVGRRRTPTSHTAFGYVLATETIQGQTRTYSPIDAAGMGTLPAGSTASLTPAANGFAAVVTTGDTATDALFGLGSTESFSPASGALTLDARRTAATVCARLDAANP